MRLVIGKLVHNDRLFKIGLDIKEDDKKKMMGDLKRLCMNNFEICKYLMKTLFYAE